MGAPYTQVLLVPKKIMYHTGSPDYSDILNIHISHNPESDFHDIIDKDISDFQKNFNFNPNFKIHLDNEDLNDY